MARQALVPQPLVVTGTNPAMTAAHVDGFKVPNTSGITFVEVVNASGVAVTVTLPTQVEVEGLAVSSHNINVPAAQRRMITLIPDLHNVRSGDDVGQAYVDITPIASVTVGAFRAR